MRFDLKRRAFYYSLPPKNALIPLPCAPVEAGVEEMMGIESNSSQIVTVILIPVIRPFYQSVLSFTIGQKRDINIDK